MDVVGKGAMESEPRPSSLAILGGKRAVEVTRSGATSTYVYCWMYLQMRRLALMVREVQKAAARLDDVDFLHASTEGPERDDFASEPSACEQEVGEFSGGEEVIQTHVRLLQKFVQEWQVYEQQVILEAVSLAKCIREGGEDYWNCTLSSAERLEGYATILREGDRYKSELMVVEAVSRYLEADESIVGESVGRVLREASADVELSHARAWMLLLGLEGGVDEQRREASSGILDASDTMGYESG
jgi:hypothetical protein